MELTTLVTPSCLFAGEWSWSFSVDGKIIECGCCRSRTVAQERAFRAFREWQQKQDQGQ